MYKYFILLILLNSSSFVPAQKCEKQVELLNQKIDSLENEIIQLKMELDSESIKETKLTDWLKENMNLIIPDSIKLNPNFNFEKYTVKLDESLKTQLKEEIWLGMYAVGEVVSTENGIVLYLSDFDLSKTLLLTPDYFVISYHTIIGDNGQSLIYSFNSNEAIVDTEIFAYEIISPSLLKVGKDYYDSRNVEDPDYEGHIFETGTYNLETGEYIFITKE